MELRRKKTGNIGKVQIVYQSIIMKSALILLGSLALAAATGQTSLRSNNGMSKKYCTEEDKVDPCTCTPVSIMNSFLILLLFYIECKVEGVMFQSFSYFAIFLSL